MTKTQLSEYYTVSEFIDQLNDALSELSGAVSGEISELSISAKGHVYFTIKDSETGDILPCTMWKSAYALNGLALELGMEVVVRGKPEYYGPFGKLSFISRSASLVGEGALKLAYDKLKKKLATEGLFAEERKRALPQFPKTIGIITSVHGEVIHDFTSNLRRAGFHLKILDCRVEGPESGRALTLSVRAMRREHIDVLLLMRGGGSIQSLAGFDNEALVREIVAFPVPVVAGIGHHNDVTLSALAADAAESTPSMVAALLNESWDKAERTLEHAEHVMFSTYENALQDSAELVEHTTILMRDVFAQVIKRYEQSVWRIKMGLLAMAKQLHLVQANIATSGIAVVRRMSIRLKELVSESLQTTASDIMNRYKSSLLTFESSFTQRPLSVMRGYGTLLRALHTRTDALARIIEGNSPERQLRLGYSIATHEGKVLRSIHEVAPGGEVQVRLADGTISTKRVEE